MFRVGLVYDVDWDGPSRVIVAAVGEPAAGENNPTITFVRVGGAAIDDTQWLALSEPAARDLVNQGVRVSDETLRRDAEKQYDHARPGHTPYAARP